MDYVLAENPYGMYASNPQRKRRKKRNPAGVSKAQVSKWTKGVTSQEALAGFANLVLTSWAPAMMVKNVSSTTDKLLRVGAAVLTAAVGAALVGVVIKQPSVAKAAAIGGFASVGVQALSVFNIASLTRGSSTRGLPPQLQRSRVAAPGTRGMGANPAVPMPARLV